MAYQEAGAESRASLALRESCLRRPSRRLVGAERVDEDGVHGRHIASGERHLAPHKTAAADAGYGEEAAAAVWDDRRGRGQEGTGNRKPATDGQMGLPFFPLVFLEEKYSSLVELKRK